MIQDVLLLFVFHGWWHHGQLSLVRESLCIYCCLDDADAVAAAVEVKCNKVEVAGKVRQSSSSEEWG